MPPKKCKQVKRRCVRKPVPPPSAALRKLAKKLRVKTKKKVGSKRVWKKESVLKKQVKRELKRRVKKEKALLKKRLAKAKKSKTKKVVKSKTKKVVKRRRSAPAFLSELQNNIANRRMSAEFGRSSRRYRNVHSFGRMPSLVQSTGFVMKPHTLSMSEKITGLSDPAYLRHVSSRRAGPVMSKPVSIASGYYGMGALGKKVNPSVKYGRKSKKACGCNKKRRRTKKSNFGFF